MTREQWLGFVTAYAAMLSPLAIAGLAVFMDYLSERRRP